MVARYTSLAITTKNMNTCMMSVDTSKAYEGDSRLFSCLNKRGKKPSYAALKGTCTIRIVQATHPPSTEMMTLKITNTTLHWLPAADNR